MIEYPEVYIAGPLFNTEENQHNKRLARMFRKEGYTVFNPIEDGIEGVKADGKTEEELVREIHTVDSTHVRNARIFVANLNGPSVDDGTAAESGMAYVAKVVRLELGEEALPLMIGYLTDTRSLTPNMRRNPLVSGSFDAIFSKREDIVAYARIHCPPVRRKN